MSCYSITRSRKYSKRVTVIGCSGPCASIAATRSSCSSPSSRPSTLRWLRSTSEALPTSSPRCGERPLGCEEGLALTLSVVCSRIPGDRAAGAHRQDDPARPLQVRCVRQVPAGHQGLHQLDRRVRRRRQRLQAVRPHTAYALVVRFSPPPCAVTTPAGAAATSS